MTSIPLCEPAFMGNERAYLLECIESGFVSSVGPFVERFETAFAKRIGSKHAIACSTGTAALHVALLVAGAEAGSVVPVSSFTFIASVNAVVYCGATPLLVDSAPQSWNMDTSRLHDHVVDLARRGLDLPPVIEIVHILGAPADLDPLLDLRDRFGIAIVEDAAEALGGRFASGQLVGSVGDLGCFSFNGNKIITSGGGGMIVTNDDTLAEQSRHLTRQAKLPGIHYAHDSVGFNYRMTNLAAALGLAQFEQLKQFLERKRRIAAVYRAELVEETRFAWQEVAPGAQHSHWLNSVMVDGTERDVIVETLRHSGIEARPVWRPCHLQRPHLAHPRLGGEVAEKVGREGLSLPSSVSLDDAQLLAIAKALKEA